MNSTEDKLKELERLQARRELNLQLIYRITDRLKCLAYHLKESPGPVYALELTPDCPYLETCEALMNATPEFRAIRKKLTEE